LALGQARSRQPSTDSNFGFVTDLIQNVLYLLTRILLLHSHEPLRCEPLARGLTNRNSYAFRFQKLGQEHWPALCASLEEPVRLSQRDDGEGVMTSFVFYDTETTGTDTAFDQILQFAAIQTDENLRELDRFEIRCRLLPHVVPAAGALIATGVSPRLLTDSALPTHYEGGASDR
jgi:hypothetical protein